MADHLVSPVPAPLSATDPLASLPPTFPVQQASKILGIGRNRTYELIKAGRYPVRVLDISGRFRVSRYDLLAYLGAGQPAGRAS